mmetsp:Transcript_23848/g.42232  ORF Transcript_23848/g.42232 Transcript_23848/m.42232 type:complete len:328 (-) Transcript_23848:41-1024(-)
MSDSTSKRRKLAETSLDGLNTPSLGDTEVRLLNSQTTPLTLSASGGKNAQVDYPNGDLYEGELLDSTPHGQGKMTYQGEDARVYSGSWLNGRRQGLGKVVWPDGATYEGDFLESEGSYFVDGQPNKSDTLYFDPGIHGVGTLTFNDGDKYHGQFSKGKFCGQGSIEANLQAYEGSWDQDEMHGFGKFICECGDVYIGIWERDLRNWQGRMVTIGQAVYEGSWREGLRHGYGIESWPDGQIYEGEFEEDMYHGQGRMQYPDQRVYEGGWTRGIKHGKGTITEANGDIYDAEYSNCTDGRRVKCVKKLRRPSPSKSNLVFVGYERIVHS